MANRSVDLVSLWWAALVNPERGAALVLDEEGGRAFVIWLASGVAGLYFLYGASMGCYRGWFPGIVSGLKLPFLYLCSLVVCFPPLYVLNALLGPRLTVGQCLRLLLMALSANAAALASYALVSLFFSLTTSREQAGYGMLVLMHVGVFAVSGMVSLAVVAVLFRATGRLAGRPVSSLFVLLWGSMYGIVGMQMAWLLRPWIGTWNIEYQPLRPLEGSFFEAVWQLLQSHF
ncbi:MAG: hypothetical protein KF858_04470 [Candidatus Sumerlaeia bacterium]|nr:hypothetical protein [Candidatus Sumerlaeia bacterium]